MTTQEKGFWKKFTGFLKKAWNWFKKVVKSLTGMVKDTSISKNKGKDDNDNGTE